MPTSTYNSLGVTGSARPPNLGMSLEYLQERVAEPCGRTVPGSILVAFRFLEKVGGVTVRGRVSGEQVLRNCVDQSTMDLEAKAESSRSGPRENYWHLQPEGLVG